MEEKAELLNTREEGLEEAERSTRAGGADEEADGDFGDFGAAEGEGLDGEVGVADLAEKQILDLRSVFLKFEFWI